MSSINKTRSPLAHTAGPWFVGDELVNVDELPIEVEGGAVIAGVWPMDEHDADDPEQAANAKLLAAAPRLYHVVRIVAAYYTQHWQGDRTRQPHFMADVQHILDQLEQP